MQYIAKVMEFALYADSSPGETRGNVTPAFTRATYLFFIFSAGEKQDIVSLERVASVARALEKSVRHHH